MGTRRNVEMAGSYPAPKVSAAARLEAAKIGKATTIKEIAEAERLRREALIEGNERAAAAADRLLVEQRMALKRRIDELEILPSLVERELEEARLPSDPTAARALLAQKERRHRALLARPLHDRSAADQMEIDSFPIVAGQLTQHIALMESLHG
jgi:hypothetical protein